MTAIVFLIAATGLMAADNADELNKKELQKLQGTWKLQSAIVANKDYPVKDLVAQTIVFADDSVTCRDINNGKKAKAKLDASKSPPVVTFYDDKGKAVREAVYQFDGESLKWVFTDGIGQDHSSVSFTKTGIDYAILTYKRDKK